MGLVKKLLIKSGYRVIVINAPVNFVLPPEELPDGVEEAAGELTGSFDFVLLFAQNQQQLSAYAADIIAHLKPDAHFWIAYPKKSSKVKTDLSRDHGWEALHQAGYTGVSLISIDDTWSGMRFRHEQYIKRSKDLAF